MLEIIVKIQNSAIDSLAELRQGRAVVLTVSGAPTDAPPEPGATVVAPRGPLAPLMVAGLLAPGDRLRFDQPRARRTAHAVVLPDGSLAVEGKPFSFRSPSKAAGAVTGSQINGWTLWNVEGSGRTLDDLRNELDERGDE